jgi:hypothetical protein
VSDKDISVLQLGAGLDLSSPKVLVQPGSLLDCMNYEVVDEEGYRRIDGYATYDGNFTAADIPNLRVYTTELDDYTDPTLIFENEPFYDEDGNMIGYVLYFGGNGVDNILDLTYVSFNGAAIIGGEVPTQSRAWTTDQFVNPVRATTLTQEQFQALQDYFISLADTTLPGVAVGLHWFRDTLYAVAPLHAVGYEASDDNQPVSYVIGDTVTTTAGAQTAILLDKVVVVEADASTPESGYLILADQTAPMTGAGNFGGAVSVGAGTIASTQSTSLDYCSVWKAVRPTIFNEDQQPSTPGWIELPHTFSVTVTLTDILETISALRRGDSVAASTYYFGDGSGVVGAVLLDYFVTNVGALDTGDAVVVLQFAAPTLESGTHELDVTTADDWFSDSGATTKLGDVTSRLSYNWLPGIPSLKANSSRYGFISANFYAGEDMDAIYGVNGAGRAFVISDDYLSMIHTQTDAALDKPRHVENHALHLALGFKQGSVQLSVTGSPTNFDGALGASDIGVGDRVTGLMSLPGSTLGVFCEQSVWSIVGSSSDAFDTQVILPKTGCIEYTLVNCGEPTFLNNTGVATLSTSANYGDFVGNKLSKRISSWLLPRLRRGSVTTMNSSGIACAIPVREKNQYRVFFNDGNIMTMTLRPGAEPAFTFQRYLYEPTYDDVTEGVYTPLIPLAYTSQVDWQGKERIFISHYNDDSDIFTVKVFALETGDSFDGYYIPHYFTTNWFFQEVPARFNTLSGVRLYGQSKGLAQLKVQAAGPQNDFYFSGNTLSTTLVPIDLPRNSPGIVGDFQPVTNRADISARGLAIQLKFSGSNTDYSLIEPSHIAQVLLVASLKDGAADL